MRKIGFSAVILMSCLPAFAVDGFNMPGLDYANFNADTSFICRDSCGGDSNVRGGHGSNRESKVRPGIAG